MDITINIPDRAGIFGGVTRFPVARVRLRLDLSGSPAGSTWTITKNGTTSDLFPFPPPGIPVFNTPWGDSVIMLQGANYIEADINLNSDFNIAGGGDYTSYAGGASAPYTITMVFTPPGGITVADYRFSSYSIPTAFNSLCPGRRLDNNPATITLNPAPAGSGQRHPIDVIFVLDKSGSMNSTVPAGLPGAGISKMDALKDALTQFIGAWDIEPTAVPEDRLGLVWFDSNATVEQFGSPPERLVPRSTGWTAIETEINGQGAGGSTALGDGITQAFFTQADVTTKNPDTVLLLLSDGRQNAGNEIILDDPGTPLALDDPLQHTYFDSIIPGWRDISTKCMAIQGVGLGADGTGTTAWEELLKDISEETGGRVDLTWGDALAGTYIAQLIEVLKGNTLSLIFETDDTLAGNPEQEQSFTFEIDASVQHFMVILNWHKPNNHSFALTVDVFDPDGNPVRFDSRVDNSFHTIRGFPMADKPSGAYTARVRHLEFNDSSIPYTLMVLVTEGALSYRVHFPDRAISTGAPINLGVELSWDGQPISDANVTVRVDRPGGALGTFLHENPVSDDILRQNPGNDINAVDQFGIVSERKIWHLLTQGSLREIIMPRSTNFMKVPMVEKGIYSFTYVDTQIPGKYTFYIEIELTTPDGALIRREETRQTVVSIQEISTEKSTINATQIQGTTHSLSMVLRDKFGNVLAPDHQKSFTLMVEKDKVPVQTSRTADGRYTAVFTAVDDPTVRISYRGLKPFVAEPLSNVLKGDIDTPDDDVVHGKILDEIREGCRNILAILLRILVQILKRLTG